MEIQKHIPEDPGIYILLLQAFEPFLITVGKLGCLQGIPGLFFYVGSARGSGGLKARISRHVSGTGTKFWHIDYLRKNTVPKEVWFSLAEDSREHSTADRLDNHPGLAIPMLGFGSSDCGCGSHLFFTDSEQVVEEVWQSVFARGGLEKKWQRFPLNPGESSPSMPG